MANSDEGPTDGLVGTWAGFATIGRGWLQGRGDVLPKAVEDDGEGTPSIRTIAPEELPMSLMAALRFAHDPTAGASASSQAFWENSPRIKGETSPPVGIQGYTMWRDLGNSLDFMGSIEHLAVLVVNRPDERLTFRGSTDLDEVVAKVDRLSTDLKSYDLQHAAIAVVGNELPPDVSREIFEAGGYVIDVPIEFYETSPDERAKFLMSLFASEAEVAFAPQAGFRDPEGSPEFYAGLNPDLTPDDFTTWKKRLRSPRPED